MSASKTKVVMKITESNWDAGDHGFIDGWFEDPEGNICAIIILDSRKVAFATKDKFDIV